MFCQRDCGYFCKSFWLTHVLGIVKVVIKVFVKMLLLLYCVQVEDISLILSGLCDNYKTVGKLWQLFLSNITADVFHLVNINDLSHQYSMANAGV